MGRLNFEVTRTLPVGAETQVQLVNTPTGSVVVRSIHNGLLVERMAVLDATNDYAAATFSNPATQPYRNVSSQILRDTIAEGSYGTVVYFDGCFTSALF